MNIAGWLFRMCIVIRRGHISFVFRETIHDVFPVLNVDVSLDDCDRDRNRGVAVTVTLTVILFVILFVI